MAGKSKRIRAAVEKVDREKLYPLNEALSLLKELSSVKFDESVDVVCQSGRECPQSPTRTYAFDRHCRKAPASRFGSRCSPTASDAEAARAAGADVVGWRIWPTRSKWVRLIFELVHCHAGLRCAWLGKLGQILGSPRHDAQSRRWEPSRHRRRERPCPTPRPARCSTGSTRPESSTAPLARSISIQRRRPARRTSNAVLMPALIQAPSLQRPRASTSGAWRCPAPWDREWRVDRASSQSAQVIAEACLRADGTNINQNSGCSEVLRSIREFVLERMSPVGYVKDRW